MIINNTVHKVQMKRNLRSGIPRVNITIAVLSLAQEQRKSVSMKRIDDCV